jgi:mRNA-degrading endonuclease RelE of RelBE toxin-antitoxin system
MLYVVVYRPSVREKDIPSLGTADARAIHTALSSKLTTHPATFGKPLRSPQHGFWSLRVGSYRVIYTIHDALVTVISIEHRKDVYSA